MKNYTSTTCALALAAAIALPAGSAAAQQATYDDSQIDVIGSIPTDLEGLEEGPDIEGMISARGDTSIRVAATDGTATTVQVSPATRIRGRGGFLGLGRTKLSETALLNGLPVKIDTVQWAGGLIAEKISFSNNDLEMARMIRNGTAQGFAEQTAATEALRGRVANIDQYNVIATTDVFFDTGKWNLSPVAERDLCAAAMQAEATDNALLLVVGYTDNVGDEDYNQILSERRAGRVVNFLQQRCRWQPWRMLSPTGMAESDPAADNSTAAGRAQNRRVSVNILVSKAVEGL